MKELNREIDLGGHLSLFLEKYVPQESAFLVAFSGGVDSTALLNGLIEAGAKTRIRVVHVDHGWREESAKEAHSLQKEMEKLAIPFYSVRLSAAPKGENLEDWSRRERQKCFSELAAKLQVQYILLAHHADDQIEVVFARFLEGSSLRNFRGMRVLEERDGLRFLRPLLGLRKEKLVQWVECKGLPFINDPTNSDSKYLRARLRTIIFPFLRKSFGKGFEESLLRVADEALLLDDWVHEAQHEAFCIERGRGVIFATAKKSTPSQFLLHSLIDTLRKQCALPAPSRSQVRDIASHFMKGSKKSRLFLVGPGMLLVDRGELIVFAKKIDPIREIMCTGSEGRLVHGPLEISWRAVLFRKKATTSWRDLFRGGEVRVYIPQKPFVLSRSSDRMLQKSKMKGRASSEFSAALRPYVPAFLQEKTLVADILTGYEYFLQEGDMCYEVVVRWQ